MSGKAIIMKKTWLLLVFLLAVETKSQNRVWPDDVQYESSHFSRYALLTGLVGNRWYGFVDPVNGSPFRYFTSSEGGVDTLGNCDSLSIKKGSVVLRICGEVGMAELLGLFFALPSGLIGSRISGNGGWDSFAGAVGGMYVGYVVGTSLGVYLVGKGEKPNSSFWVSLAGGIVGAGLGLEISELSHQRGVGSLAPLILPVTASIVCVELIY